MQKFFMGLFLFTMFFSGGLIPTYMLVSRLKMTNTIWAMLLPAALSVYNMILVRTFLTGSIPHELLEASQIDGCSDAHYFTAVLLPLSKPVIAVITLYYAVGLWNSYFGPMIYLGKKELQPLSLYIRSVMMQNSIESLAGSPVAIDVKGAALLSALQIKYAVIVIAVLPMMLIYPLISKNLEKGLMIGAVKA